MMKRYFDIKLEQTFGDITANALKENSIEIFSEILPSKEELFLMLSAVNKESKIEHFFEQLKDRSNPKIELLLSAAYLNIPDISECNFLGTIFEDAEQKKGITNISQYYTFYETPNTVFRIKFRPVFCTERLTWTGDDARLKILDKEDSKEIKHHFSN